MIEKMEKDRTTWLVSVAIMLVVAGFVLALVVTKAPAPSAAATVRWTILGLILTPIALIVGFAAVQQWWRRRVRRQRLEDALTQAQVYRALQGTSEQPRRQRSQPRRRSDLDGINIILPNQQMSHSAQPPGVLSRIVGTRQRDDNEQQL